MIKRGRPRKSEMAYVYTAYSALDITAPPKSDRNLQIAKMYCEGRTLEECGAAFAMTRERARQIIKAQGLSRNDGGQAKKTEPVKAERAAKKRELEDRRIRAWHERKCYVCGIVKPLSEFSVNHNNPQGVGYKCKPCGSAIAREKYHNPDSGFKSRQLEWQRNHPEKNREYVRRHKAKKAAMAEAARQSQGIDGG